MRASSAKSSTSATSSAPAGPARVGGVEAVVSVSSTSRLGADEDRHLRGEEVVVAEGDLVGGGRVVLVDHRHDAPVEQLAQRLARVEVAGAVR